MRTAKSRAIIRHISVLSLLILLSAGGAALLALDESGERDNSKACPRSEAEEAITHLKERGLYASLGEAVKRRVTTPSPCRRTLSRCWQGPSN